MPLLMWPEGAILVAAQSVLQRLLMVEIPQLQQWIQTPKSIRTGCSWPHDEFKGLLLVTPEAWLADRLEERGGFPSGIPTILDGVDDLEEWAHHQLRAGIQPADWNELMLARPDAADAIRDARVQLTRAVFQRSPNPYECYLIEAPEQEILKRLFEVLQNALEQNSAASLPTAWRNFLQRSQTDSDLIWAEIARRQGQFSLYCGPVEVASKLEKIWPSQPVVLIGGAVDLEASAEIYRQRLGLGDLTCVKFQSDRHKEAIHLYLPDRLPLPNTPQFQAALLLEFRSLLLASAPSLGLRVLIVGDMPLKAIVGSVLAAEFGSRVAVERTCLDDNGILVTGWEFWRQQQQVLPAPVLLAIATLPIPSLENPLVAGRVAYYKQRRQDWFRLYLLPTALTQLQRAIAEVRDRNGLVALFDSRVLHRSYGRQVLAALSPLARIDYLDAIAVFSWMEVP